VASLVMELVVVAVSDVVVVIVVVVWVCDLSSCYGISRCHRHWDLCVISFTSHCWFGHMTGHMTCKNRPRNDL